MIWTQHECECVWIHIVEFVLCMYLCVCVSFPLSLSHARFTVYNISIHIRSAFNICELLATYALNPKILCNFNWFYLSMIWIPWWNPFYLSYRRWFEIRPQLIVIVQVCHFCDRWEQLYLKHNPTCIRRTIKTNKNKRNKKNGKWNVVTKCERNNWYWKKTRTLFCEFHKE